MKKKLYMDGILEERARIITVIKCKIDFLRANYPKDEKEKVAIGRLLNLKEEIEYDGPQAEAKGKEEKDESRE